MSRIIFLFLLNCLTLISYGQNFRFLDLPLNDICYDPFKDKIYGVSGGTYAQGNAILVINPSTGTLEQRIPVGSEPSRIRISEDGRFLYVALLGSPHVQRYDLLSQKFLPLLNLELVQVQLGFNAHFALHTSDMVILPRSERSLVVSRLSLMQRPSLFDIVAYDDLQARSLELDFSRGGNHLILADDGKTIWGLGDDYFPEAFKRFQVEQAGLTELESYPSLITGEVTHVAYQKGRIYLQNGQIFDVSKPGAPQLLTTLNIGQAFNRTEAPQVPALDSNYIYYTSDLDSNNIHTGPYRGSFLKVIDKTSFQLIRSIPIPAPGQFWNGESTKKIISLGKGRIALLSEFYGRSQLMLFESKPCPSQQLNLTIRPGGDTRVCSGDSIELKANPGYLAYYWSNGMQGAAIKHVNYGNSIDTLRYRVIGPNGCISSPSAPQVLYFSEKPVNLGFQNYESILCPDQNTNLLLVPDRWSSLFAWSNGDTLRLGQALKVNAAGVYTVRSRGLYGCWSEPQSIEIFEAISGGSVRPKIAANGPLSYCDNQATVFSGPVGAYAYEWSSGESTRSIKLNYSTNLALRLVYANGCKSPWSDTLKVKVSYRPPASTPMQVVQQFNQLRLENISFLIDSLKWFYNGAALPNSNRNFWAPTSKGFYSAISYYGGCPSEPAQPFVYPQTIKLEINSIPLNQEFTSYRLYPNVSPLDNYRAKWSNGSTEQYVDVNASGTYCLTLFRDAYPDSASACITLEPKGNIEVQVLDASSPIVGLPVVLYQFQNLNVTVMDTLLSDTQGKALFRNIKNGTYFSQAIPKRDSPLANIFQATYARDAVLWNNAMLFTLKGIRPTISIPEVMIIFMQRIVRLQGEGTISGYLRSGEGFAPDIVNNFRTSNTPLANVSIVLLDANGIIVASTFSDYAGFYTFSNLPYGSYTVVTNLLGLPPARQFVTISSSQPKVNGINFLLKNGSFLIVDTKSTVEIELNVWPNPVDQLLYIEIPEKAYLSIYDTFGRIIVQRVLPKGIHQEKALALQIPGMYCVRIQNESGQVGIKNVIKQ